MDLEDLRKPNAYKLARACLGEALENDAAVAQEYVDKLVAYLQEELTMPIVESHVAAIEILRVLFNVSVSSSFTIHEAPHGMTIEDAPPGVMNPSIKDVPGSVIGWSEFPRPAPATRITMDVFRAGAREGDRVRYVPAHANGDPDHPDCENGRISSFSDTNVFVRFDKQVDQHGWDNTLAKACDPNDLRIL